MIPVHGLFDLNSEARLGGHPRVPRSSAFDARRVTISPRTGIPMRDGRMACCCRQTLTAQQQSTDWQNCLSCFGAFGGPTDKSCYRSQRTHGC